MEHKNLYASKGADLLFENGDIYFQSKIFNTVDRISYEDKDVIIAESSLTSEEMADLYISFEGTIEVLEEAKSHEDGSCFIKKNSFYNMRCVFDRTEADYSRVTTYTFIFANGNIDVDKVLAIYYNKKREVEALRDIASNIQNLSFELNRIEDTIDKTNQRIDMIEECFGAFLSLTTNAMKKVIEDNKK